MRPLRDDAALEETAWLRRLAARVAGGSRADDLAQDAAIAALRGRRPEGDRRAWLAGILRNLARQERRGRARRARREAVAARPLAIPPAARQVEEEEMRRRLHAAVAGLPRPYRDAVRARHLEGRSCAAIARAQGVPASTVRNRLRRGLLLLRADLMRAYGGDPRALSLLPLFAPFPRPRRRRLAFAAGVLALCALAVPASASSRSDSAPARVEVREAVPAPAPPASPARPEHSRSLPPGIVAP